MGSGSSYQKSDYVEKYHSVEKRQPKKNKHTEITSIKNKYNIKIYVNDYEWDKAKVVGRNE